MTIVLSLRSDRTIWFAIASFPLYLNVPGSDPLCPASELFTDEDEWIAVKCYAAEFSGRLCGGLPEVINSVVFIYSSCL